MQSSAIALSIDFHLVYMQGSRLGTIAGLVLTPACKLNMLIIIWAMALVQENILGNITKIYVGFS